MARGQTTRYATVWRVYRDVRAGDVQRKRAAEDKSQAVSDAS